MIKTIKVADTEAFSKARELLSRSDVAAVSEKTTILSDDGNIRWGDAVFEAAEDGGGYARRKADEKTATLTERFQTLYDHTKREDNSWSVFLEGLISEFYQKYALLIYEPITSEEEAEKYVVKLAKILKLLARDPDARYLVEKSDGVAEKICIATVKLRLDLGGAPIPAIVPFYFKVKEDGKYVELLPPLKSRSIHRQIAALSAQSQGERGRNRTDTRLEGDFGALVAAVTEELKKTLSKEDGFGDWLILSDEAKKKVSEYVRGEVKLASGKDASTMTDDEVFAEADTIGFRASGAQLRYVAILDCFCPAYAVYDQDDPARRKRYEVTFDLSWRADVRCGKCGKLLLCDSVIVAGGREIAFDLTAEEPLSDADKTYLGTHGTAFLKHAQKKSCEWKNGRCETVVCDGELIACGKCEDKKFAFCKSCPHPEVVYMSEENGAEIPYHTKHLVFVQDSFSLLPADQTSRCRVCGRIYSQNALNTDGGVCKFCAPVLTGARDTRYRKLFRDHKGMLPYWRRFGKNNVCNEDDAMILFRSGKKIYRLDKAAIKTSGYLTLHKVPLDGSAANVSKKEGAHHGRTK